MITDQEYKKLKEASLFRTQENVNFFETKVWEFVQNKDPQNIPILLNLFDDNTRSTNVMYTLVHALESYEDEVYVKEILKHIKKIQENAPFWLLGLFCEILNNKSTFMILKKKIKTSNKEDLLKLFDLIEKESEHHRGVIQELRQELES